MVWLRAGALDHRTHRVRAVARPIRPWILVGTGYAVLAIAMFIAGHARHRHVEEALEAGTFSRLDRRVVDGMTVVGSVLALSTIALIVFAL